MNCVAQKSLYCPLPQRKYGNSDILTHFKNCKVVACASKQSEKEIIHRAENPLESDENFMKANFDVKYTSRA